MLIRQNEKNMSGSGDPTLPFFVPTLNFSKTNGAKLYYEKSGYEDKRCIKEIPTYPTYILGHIFLFGLNTFWQNN